MMNPAAKSSVVTHVLVNNTTALSSDGQVMEQLLSG
jgi:hypothetical protein